MENIDKQLNNLSVVEVPAVVHQSTMRKIKYQKTKPVFFTAFALLAFSFVIVVWQINTNLTGAEFLDMVSDFFDVFNFDFSFWTAILTGFFGIVSPALFMVAIASLTGLIYIGNHIRHIRSYKFA